MWRDLGFRDRLLTDEDEYNQGEDGETIDRMIGGDRLSHVEPDIFQMASR